MLDSVVKVNEKHYPQILLEECKYDIKKTKMENLINVMIQKDIHLMMNLIMNLTMNVVMNNLLMNLRIKTVF